MKSRTRQGAEGYIVVVEIDPLHCFEVSVVQQPFQVFLATSNVLMNGGDSKGDIAVNDVKALATQNIVAVHNLDTADDPLFSAQEER